MAMTDFEFNLFPNRAPATIPIDEKVNEIEFMAGEPLIMIRFERNNGSFIETSRRTATEEERLESWLLRHRHGRSYRDVVSEMILHARFEARWDADASIGR